MSIFDEVGQEILDENGYEDWEVVDDSLLRDPDGNLVEWDNPRSPFRLMGMI